jgi:hypothetical protein
MKYDLVAAAFPVTAVVCLNIYFLSGVFQEQHHCSPPPVCGWSFERYVPSALELHWTRNILGVQDSVCLHSNGDDPVSMDNWVSWVGRSRVSHVEGLPDSVFSYFLYTDNCTGETSFDHIEPLAGLLRHPYFCLKGEEYLVDKDYLLVSWNVSRRMTPGAKAYLFDMGASLFDEGAGGASQAWFVSEYERVGVRWDGVYAYESREYAPADVYSRVPSRVKPVYHWYNIPVSAEAGHPDNVWEHVKAVASQDDYVVVKLDIDNTPLEETLVGQLIGPGSDSLLRLVDEFYFEHHVHTRPMDVYWGTEHSPRRLSDSYALLSELRSRGVKAHAWI